MKRTVQINGLSELKDFSKRFANCLSGDEIILLKGNLGAGKTTFTKFLVSSLGGSEEDVNSPTFTVMNEYDTEKFAVYHIDLYRVKEFDITDFVGHGIIVIEWPEEDYSQYGVPVIEITFEYGDDEDKRILVVSSVYKANRIFNCLFNSD